MSAVTFQIDYTDPRNKKTNALRSSTRCPTSSSSMHSATWPRRWQWCSGSSSCSPASATRASGRSAVACSTGRPACTPTPGSCTTRTQLRFREGGRAGHVRARVRGGGQPAHQCAPHHLGHPGRRRDGRDRHRRVLVPVVTWFAIVFTGTQSRGSFDFLLKVHRSACAPTPTSCCSPTVPQVRVTSAPWQHGGLLTECTGATRPRLPRCRARALRVPHRLHRHAEVNPTDRVSSRSRWWPTRPS